MTFNFDLQRFAKPPETYGNLTSGGSTIKRVIFNANSIVFNFYPGIELDEVRDINNSELLEIFNLYAPLSRWGGGII